MPEGGGWGDVVGTGWGRGGATAVGATKGGKVAGDAGGGRRGRGDLPSKREVLAAMRAARLLVTTEATLGRGLSHEVRSVTLVGSAELVWGRSMER
jgi:hypothetical protein